MALESLSRVSKKTALCHQDITSALSTLPVPCNYATISLVLKLDLPHPASLRLEAPRGPANTRDVPASVLTYATPLL